MHLYELISFSTHRGGEDDCTNTMFVAHDTLALCVYEFGKLVDSLLDEALERRKAAWANPLMDNPIWWSTLIYDVRDLLVERHGFKALITTAYERDSDECFGIVKANKQPRVLTVNGRPIPLPEGTVVTYCQDEVMISCDKPEDAVVVAALLDGGR